MTVQGKREKPGRNEFVSSLATGLSVLECFSPVDSRLSLTQVAERAGLSRATARRMLLTLTELGYAYSDGRYFELTPRVLALGHGYWSGRGWHELLAPSLRKLSEELDESCSAAILVNDDVLYVSRVHTRRIMRIELGLGTRLPAFATSMGRILLADLPEEALRARLQDMDTPALTAHTVTDVARLAELISRAGEDAFALVDQELEPGLRSAAVPVKDPGGRTVLAINTSMTASAETADQTRNRVRPALDACAAEVQTLLRSLGSDLDSLLFPRR
ncbi:IclR family transcriptional regulator domain-containing protein [Nesterenkonia haasae]|uniref:IclR family transcriptional regulator domain-containing protein n=1 Tax=Nesterenkonia haasae TaxID=2587813 RepID=UPI0013920B8F|nr:IclR family transcriptional regulator C-terminal domain-containing protein [Nesterenkonia haasae]NDK31904.1 helix-turn-helix domain-containing protein [Nesterenkonia haasae]